MRLNTSIALLIVLNALASSSGAEPVEVRQGEQIGAGYTFRRGATCTVVTVRHAVLADGVEVRVTDRSGGTATGQRSYDNETYDLALVTLPEKSAVACTASWPDTGWIASTKFNTKSSFDVVRHTPDDRETILPARYVGGTSNTITLAPVGKMKTQVTFSGSVVFADEKLLALVQQVDPATDRIEALRFDVIDRLVGSRFKGATRGGSPVYFAGVFQRDRINPNWTTYVSAWLNDERGHPVMSTQNASVSCSIRVNVIDWTRKNVPNPQYAALEQRYGACGTMGAIGGVLVLRSSPEAKAACQKQVRAQMNEAGRYLKGHSLTMEAVMTPKDGAIESKLDTVDVVVPSGASASRTEEEMAVMQKAAGSMLTKLFETGVCD